MNKLLCCLVLLAGFLSTEALFKQVISKKFDFTLTWSVFKASNIAQICFSAKVPNSKYYAAIGFKEKTKMGGFYPKMMNADIVAGIGGLCDCVQTRTASRPVGYPGGNYILQIYDPDFTYSKGKINVCFNRAISNPKHGNTTLTDNDLIIWAVAETGYNQLDIGYHFKNAGNATVNWISGPKKRED
eukprot:TRINITY_DN76484_c0_g1_i1.p2 TRINITY_DN76484_c0_g1~~TRINITY_DN76484_c0_g1_i1.p2  ORF type:complete len:186 (-),score=44.42 TRINITY_DN76484_c0_g1_i1:124-681(-)